MSMRTKAVVKFSCVPKRKDELGLTKGEHVYVVEKSTDGWWKGEADGKTGWFRSNYVEEVEASSNGNQGSIQNRNLVASVPPPAAMQPPPHVQQVSAPRASLEDEQSNGIKRVAFSLNNNCAVAPSTNKIPIMSMRTKAVVKFSCVPKREDELGLTKGQYVNVVEKSTDGWWKGEADGNTGWFRSNYVEEVEASSNGNQGSIQNRNPVASVPPPAAMQSPPQQQQVSAPRASRKVVVALYSFDAASSEELSIHKGEYLQLVNQHNFQDWWKVCNREGIVGNVPRHCFGIHTQISVNKSGSHNDRIPVESVPPPAAMQLPPQQQQVSAPRAHLEIGVALSAFNAASPDELSFIKDERLEIVSHIRFSDYLYARNSQGIVGLVPLNYIEVINPSSSTTQDFAPQYSGKPETLIEQEPWFFGRISSDRAEELLHHGREGEFLVRDSESNPGDLYISIRGVGRIDHFKVRNVDGQLKFGNRKFMNMKALITHYTTDPILSFPSAKLYLTGPLPK